MAWLGWLRFTRQSQQLTEISTGLGRRREGRRRNKSDFPKEIDEGVRTQIPDDVSFFILHVDCHAALRPI